MTRTYRPGTFLRRLHAHGNRQVAETRRTVAFYASIVRFLRKQPFHIQKMLLSFMPGPKRSILSRMLAASRLQRRLRR